MTNGLRSGSLLLLIISFYWKKIISRQHTKNLNVRARPDVTDWAVGYLSPHTQSMTKTPVKIRKNRYKTVGRVAPTRPLSIYIVIDNDGKMAKFNL